MAKRNTDYDNNFPDEPSEETHVEVFDDDLDEPISKSERKRNMHALQALGEELAALDIDKLKKLDAPEALKDALLEATRLKSHGARRRQMQYVGKLMREFDPAPLQEQLDRIKGVSKSEAALVHLAEKWRERLLKEDGAVGDFRQRHPEADIEKMITLIADTHKERELEKPPRAFRALFRLLIDTLRKKINEDPSGQTR